ncbi:DNA topology modulation protein [Oceanobacillus chungangensis]|uniref:AAA family ATPase n=1 Tax=Oceanobacillus chungangensis TaxID=1229152 RepID=A0A3D8PYE8_9BACI|nr:DNA topology modulation protein [Oceanobacillus chungangensis]RDW19835.1 AAA family ATPase [Oceanobacillus chungangensis]
MKKILILGGSGAGKSTLAKNLGSTLNIPVYHLDAIYWQPGWQPLDREIFITKQSKISKEENWIMDGNYGATIDSRLELADTVIVLHYSTIRYLYGIIKRRIQYRNKTRSDMGKDCPEKIDWEFFNWVMRFNRNQTPLIYQKLRQFHDKTVLIFHSPKQLKRFLMELED